MATYLIVDKGFFVYRAIEINWLYWRYNKIYIIIII